MLQPFLALKLHVISFPGPLLRKLFFELPVLILAVLNKVDNEALLLQIYHYFCKTIE